MLKSTKKEPKIKIVTWPEVRQEVISVNKQLGNIIDECMPSSKHKLVKVSYSYGDIIVDNGFVKLPTPDGLKFIEEIDNSEIKNQLLYQPIPLFLTLKNDNEVFVNTGNRVVPLNLFHQGSLLGIFETIDYIYNKKSTSKWCVSAGARSIAMLPRITDKIGLDRLRQRFNIPATLPLQTLQDHWDFFTAITKHESFEQPWKNEILFFTKDWIADNDIKWLKFKDYIFEHGWKQAQFSIGKIEANLQWESFAEAISLRNLKPRPYLADQIKHLISIATKKSPGFRPVGDNQNIAPIKGIQNAILNIYQLKDYIPTVMCICPLEEAANKIPLYYSMSFMTLLEGTPIDKSTSTIMLDLRKIKLLLDTLKQYTKNNASFKHNMLNDTEIIFFHSDKDKLGEIRHSSEIFLEDEAFLKEEKLFPGRKLCESSQFWRGCIRIKPYSISSR